MALQQVMLIGNLGADPESRFTAEGTQMVSLRIACKNTGKDKGTSWYRATCAGRTGEIAVEYLKKGQEVCVIGDQSIREFQANDGTTRTSVEVFVKTLTLLSGRGGSDEDDEQPRQQQRPAARQQQRSSGGTSRTPDKAVDDDSEIPF